MDINKSRPFFPSLALSGVPTPLEAKKGLIEKYKKKPGVGGHDDPVYAAMIESIDQSVGRIMQKLAQLQLADKTIVIFMSDNGGLAGAPTPGDHAPRLTHKVPLRRRQTMVNI